MLLRIIFILIATSVFASDNSDLRPVWMSDEIIFSSNSLMIYSTQKPNFQSLTLQEQILSNSNVKQIEQQYIDRNKDYESRLNYGLINQSEEGSYISDVSGMGKSMFTTVKLSPIRQYQQNVEQSEKQGNISQPITFLATAVALGSGTPVQFKLNDNAKGTWTGDLINQHSELNIFSNFVNSKIEMNIKNASQDPTQPLNPNSAAERYKVSVNKEIGYQLNSSIVYGSTSSSVFATINRPFLPNFSGSLGTTRSVGNDISGAPNEVLGNLSYGIKF